MIDRKIEENARAERFRELLNMSLPIPPSNPTQLQLAKQQIQNEKNPSMVQTYLHLLEQFKNALKQPDQQILYPLIQLCKR